MIIRCPECSTGFNLPDKRITPDGVKLRCSRCSHIFRIRGEGEGEVEFYYNPGDNEEESAAPGPLSSGDGESPFPHAGLGLKPKKSSAFGDLSDDDDEMSAFEGAFDDEEPLEMEVVEEEETVQMDRKFQPPPGAQAPPGVGGPSSSAAEDDAAPEEDDEPAPLMGSGSDFGSAEDMVDPSFGQDGAHFDPDKGKVEASPAKKPAGPRAGHPAAATAPPTAQKRKAAPAPVARARKATPAQQWDEEDLAAHRIGGGMGTKVVTFLFLICVVTMGFFGLVAYLNDGFIDFKAFPNMLEVAFSDGDYEPRAEWVPNVAPTVVRAPEDPITVESVFGELVSVGRNDHIFVVKGMVRNHRNTSFDGVELRGIISSPEGRVRRQIAGPVGDEIPMSEFRALRQVDQYRDLFGQGSDHVAAEAMVPFTMVFDEPPQAVIDGESFLLRVELAERFADEGEPVAAQD